MHLSLLLITLSARCHPQRRPRGPAACSDPHPGSPRRRPAPSRTLQPGHLEASCRPSSRRCPRDGNCSGAWTPRRPAPATYDPPGSNPRRASPPGTTDPPGRSRSRRPPGRRTRGPPFLHRG